jgi:hypothetical protein
VKPADFSEKKREYQKDKINELATNSKNKNIRQLCREINEFKERSNLVKDEDCDKLADSNTIVNRWKCYFSQVLNVHNISVVRQREIRSAEPLVLDPNHLEVEIAIVRLKRYKSPGSDQISAELFQAGGEILVSVIHKLINSIWNKEELSDQWKEPIILPVHKEGYETDCNNYRGISLHQISFFHGYVHK